MMEYDAGSIVKTHVFVKANLTEAGLFSRPLQELIWFHTAPWAVQD